MQIDKNIKVIYLEVGGHELPIDNLIWISRPNNREPYWIIRYADGETIWTSKEVLFDFKEVRNGH